MLGPFSTESTLKGSSKCAPSGKCLLHSHTKTAVMASMTTTVAGLVIVCILRKQIDFLMSLEPPACPSETPTYWSPISCTVVFHTPTTKTRSRQCHVCMM